MLHRLVCTGLAVAFTLMFESARAQGSITEMCFSGGGACPCGNDGVPPNGCANSANLLGAHLSGTGNPSVILDTVQVVATGIRMGSPTLALFISGSPTTPPVAMADGLLCAGQPTCCVWRWSIPGGAGGTITLTGPGGTETPCPGCPVATTIVGYSACNCPPLISGQTRVYTVLYRDPHPAFGCAGLLDTWNYTNGLQIAWRI